MNKQMFFEKALEDCQKNVLELMAAAVSETRDYSSNEHIFLTEIGGAGLLRLYEIWSTVCMGSQNCWPPQCCCDVLADIIPQVYVFLIQHPLAESHGLAMYIELGFMMDSLVEGEWFEWVD